MYEIIGNSFESLLQKYNFINIMKMPVQTLYCKNFPSHGLFDLIGHCQFENNIR
jgi:hypothetical protein